MKLKTPQLFTPTHAFWGWGLKWRSSNWFTVFVVTFAVFTDVCFFSFVFLLPLQCQVTQKKTNVNWAADECVDLFVWCHCTRYPLCVGV
jgi:hypothetical protein